jgi:serine protease
VNLTPAKIINLSLGGTGACPNSYEDAINQVTALGVLVVASAGNEGGPVDAPANCNGVAGVTGLRAAGTKVGYSSLGPQIALAAPAGNCGNAFTTAQSPCVYTMTTTTNLGYQQPDQNDYTGEFYCDPTSGAYTGCTLANSNQYRTYNIGTSFSAPVVSGIAALMSAVNGKLNSCQLIGRLRQARRPFRRPRSMRCPGRRRRRCATCPRVPAICRTASASAPATGTHAVPAWRTHLLPSLRRCAPLPRWRRRRR